MRAITLIFTIFTCYSPSQIPFLSAESDAHCPITCPLALSCQCGRPTPYEIGRDRSVGAGGEYIPAPPQATVPRAYATIPLRRRQTVQPPLEVAPSVYRDSVDTVYAPAVEQTEMSSQAAYGGNMAPTPPPTNDDLNQQGETDTYPAEPLPEEPPVYPSSRPTLPPTTAITSLPAVYAASNTYPISSMAPYQPGPTPPPPPNPFQYTLSSPNYQPAPSTPSLGQPVQSPMVLPTAYMTPSNSNNQYSNNPVHPAGPMEVSPFYQAEACNTCSQAPSTAVIHPRITYVHTPQLPPHLVYAPPFGNFFGAGYG